MIPIGFFAQNNFKNWIQPNWVSGAANNTIGLMTENGYIYDGDWGGHFVKYDGTGAVQWQRTFTTPGGLRFACIGGNSANAFSAAGYDFGNSLTTAVSYSSSGTLEWQKTLTNFGVNGILKNSGSSTFVVGTGSVGGKASGVWVSLTSNGSVGYQFNMNMPATGAEVIFNAIAEGAGNAYYIHGTYYNGTTQNQYQPLLVKISNTGGILWQRTLTAGTAGDPISGKDVAYDPVSDSVIITGGGPEGSSYQYVAKFSSTGTLTWIKKPSKNTFNVVGQGVAVDSSGNIYQTAAGGNLLKYDPDGNSLFIKVVSAVPKKVVVSQTNATSSGVYFNIENPAAGYGQLFKTPLDGIGRNLQTGYYYTYDPNIWMFTSSLTASTSSISTSTTVTVVSSTAGGTSAVTTTAQPALVRF